MRQALEMALEALGESQQILDEYATEFIFTRQKNNDAITAIKEALAQPERTWVGLTDEDEIPWDGVDAKSFARAIEAKLKEKNT